jgi:hypothetical protein
MMSKNNHEALFGIAIFGLLLTTIYTAILASQLISTKQKVDYLFFKSRLDEEES